HAYAEGGRRREARAIAEAALARARAAEEPLLIAEAQLALGVAGDDPTARASLEESAYAASALGDRRLYAIASAALAGTLGLAGDELDEAEAWIRQALAALPRLGDDPEVEALIAWIEGGLLARRGRFEAALPRLERASLRAREA